MTGFLRGFLKNPRFFCVVCLLCYNVESTEDYVMDAFSLLTTTKIDCLDKGFVQIVDVMPREIPEGQTCDYAICQAARVSYGDGTKTVNEDKGLDRYLMRHSHTTPNEMIVFKYRIKVPIFIARQMTRHRMISLNEVSGRYSVMKDDFYIPRSEEMRAQSKTNKQGSDGVFEKDQAEVYAQSIEKHCRDSYDIYLKMIESGVSREQARMVLPLNLYTEFYWKQDLHNLLHFLSLRTDSHAQYEVQVYANAMLDLIRPLVPWTIEAWDDYHVMRGAIKLTRLEKEALIEFMQNKNCQAPDIKTDNKREQAEWKEKAKKLGFNN